MNKLALLLITAFVLMILGFVMVFYWYGWKPLLLIGIFMTAGVLNLYQQKKQ